jgi:hypothetical protein
MAAPTFTAHRRASADGERRGERFDDGNHRPDYAVFVIDRVHHLGHAVSARFRREFSDQEGDDLSADDRNEDDQHAPRARRREYVRLVIEREDAEKTDVMDEADKIAEQHRAKAGDKPDDDRQQRKPPSPSRRGHRSFIPMPAAGRHRRPAV